MNYEEIVRQAEEANALLESLSGPDNPQQIEDQDNQGKDLNQQNQAVPGILASAEDKSTALPDAPSQPQAITDPAARIAQLEAENAQLRANYDNLRSFSDRTAQALRNEIASLKAAGAVSAPNVEQQASHEASNIASDDDDLAALKERALAAKEDYGEVGDLLFQVLNTVEQVKGQVAPLAEVVSTDHRNRAEQDHDAARQSFDQAMAGIHPEYMEIKGGALNGDFIEWASIRPYAGPIVESGSFDQVARLLSEYKQTSPGFMLWKQQASKQATTEAIVKEDNAAELDNEGMLPRRSVVVDPALIKAPGAERVYTTSEIRAIQRDPVLLQQHLDSINKAMATGRIVDR